MVTAPLLSMLVIPAAYLFVLRRKAAQSVSAGVPDRVATDEPRPYCGRRRIC